LFLLEDILLTVYGPEGIRTPDLYSAIVALSQLSYRPGTEEIVVAAWEGVKMHLP
jgi:hypothetical protein